MSDSDDHVPPSLPSKVSPLPTRLAKHLEFVAQELEKKDAENSNYKPKDAVSGDTVGGIANSEGLKTNREPIGQPKPADGPEAILQAVIGLGLMIVGIATMLAVGDLPRRKLTPIFLAAAAIFLLGGAWRIDKAFRSYRATKHQPGSPKQRS